MSAIITEICQKLVLQIFDGDIEKKYSLLLKAMTQVNNPNQNNKAELLWFDTSLTDLSNQKINVYFIDEIKDLILDYIKKVNEKEYSTEREYGIEKYNENFHLIISIIAENKEIAHYKTPYSIARILIEEERKYLESLLVNKNEKTEFIRL